jgi:hypothetical protein
VAIEIYSRSVSFSWSFSRHAPHVSGRIYVRAGWALTPFAVLTSPNASFVQTLKLLPALHALTHTRDAAESLPILHISHQKKNYLP